MDYLNSKEFASVVVFDVRLSEGEMEFLLDTLNYILTTKTDEELFEIYTVDQVPMMDTPLETREFIEDRYKEMKEMMKAYCRPEFLPKRLKD